MNDINLVNLNIDTSGLKEPGKELIHRLFDIVGLNPIERDAKAKAKAKLIMAQAEIDEFDLRSRAAHRIIHEETKRQLNMESIAMKALQFINDDARPKNVEDDWITNFFDKSRNVSDEEIQGLWAKVLAGEANEPGAYSKKTVNVLGDREKEDAELFRCLCGFVWKFDALTPVVFDYEEEIYTQQGITFEALLLLENLGLLTVRDNGNFGWEEKQKIATYSYYGKQVKLYFYNEMESLSVGKALFTRAGQQLFAVCDSKPINGFFEYVYSRWAKEGLVPPREE